MRRAIPTLLTLAACAAAMAGCTQPARPDGARAEIAAVQGDLTVGNSKNGQAIFVARGLAPGEARNGEVKLTNSGRLAGQLALVQAEIRDRPGAGGGLLSDKVLLAVRDVTRAADPITVFAGPLGVLDDRSLGTIAPGQTRSYAFTVRLPDGGRSPGPLTGDNAYLGSSLTVRYDWRATAPGQVTTAPPVARPPAGSPVVPRVTWRVRTRRLLKRGILDVIVRCDRPCRVAARAQLPRLRKGGKRRRTRVRAVSITNPAKARRIRLRVNRGQRRRLRARVAKRRKVTLKVRVASRSLRGGRTVKAGRRVTVRRKRARASR